GGGLGDDGEVVDIDRGAVVQGTDRDPVDLCDAVVAEREAGGDERVVKARAGHCQRPELGVEVDHGGDRIVRASNVRVVQSDVAGRAVADVGRGGEGDVEGGQPGRSVSPGGAGL